MGGEDVELNKTTPTGQGEGEYVDKAEFIIISEKTKNRIIGLIDELKELTSFLR